MSTAGRPHFRFDELRDAVCVPREQTLIHFCLRAPATELAAIAFFAVARPWQNTSVLRAQREMGTYD